MARGGRKCSNGTARLALRFDQLQHAIAAADNGSFHRAAKSLSVKHSTITRSVQLLEHRFGAAIFERSTGGVQPTPVGRQFLRIARSMLEQVDSLTTFTRAAGRGEAGRLAIGFCTSLTAGNLRASLFEFHHRYPQIELAVVERRRANLAAALLCGTIDILILTGPIPTVKTSEKPLWTERVLLALPVCHHLAAQQAIYWTDLRDETIIVSKYDPGKEIEDLLVSKLASPDERPRIKRPDVSRGVVKSLVTMGLGLSIVLESDLGAKLSGLEYRELRDGAGPSILGYSAYWQADNENPALQTFLGLLSERYPSCRAAD
jgi:DNA-binding transcriptional LysR family regulator